MTTPSKKKIEKVDEDMVDAAARHVAANLTEMLKHIPDEFSPVTQPARPGPDIRPCSFCGGAGQIETEVEDYDGSTITVTLSCPHPPKKKGTRT